MGNKISHTHHWHIKWVFVFWFVSALTFCGEPDLRDVIVERASHSHG